jgi:hypothetical protein
MSVNRISQSQHHEAEAVQGANALKSPGASSKAKAVDGQTSRAHSEQPAQSQPAATADDNAGHEQAKQQNSGNDTNGTRVNVFA